MTTMLRRAVQSMLLVLILPALVGSTYLIFLTALIAIPIGVGAAVYLEEYARHFSLPVRSGVQVSRLSRTNGGFRLETSDGELRADRVVVATGGYQTPVIPDFATELAVGIRQLHSDAYRNPEQLDGPVLVVGAGNSGAEIGLEAARSGHQIWLSGRNPGEVPFRIDGPRARFRAGWRIAA